MEADPGPVIVAFGKNEQVKRVFWAVFTVMARQVLTRVMDLVIIQQIFGFIPELMR